MATDRHTGCCISLGIFYFSKHFMADELIHANHRVATLQQDLQDTLNLLEAEKARLTIRLRSGSLRTPVEQSVEWQSLFKESGSGIPARDDPAPALED